MDGRRYGRWKGEIIGKERVGMKEKRYKRRERVQKNAREGEEIFKKGRVKGRSFRRRESEGKR